MSDSRPDVDALVLEADPDFGRVMECVFGIQPHETRAYFALLEAPGSTVGELAGDLARDRSSVTRAISTLHETGLVERERRLLEGGGYVYQYYAVPLERAKVMMHETLDDWAAGVHEKIDEFGG